MENRVVRKYDMDDLFHILLKPDAFKRSLISELIQWLNRNGVEIYSANLLKPNSELLQLMYDGEFKWKYDYYNHNKELYTVGPSLSLICRNTLNKVLVDIKGASLPIDARINTIRYDFDVKDRCLNLIHIANNQISSYIELKSIYYLNDEKIDVALLRYLPFSTIINTINFMLGDSSYYSYNGIISLLKLRVKYMISTILYINMIISYEEYTDFEAIDLRKYLQFIPSHLYEINDMLNNNKQIVMGYDIGKKLRYLNYIFTLASKLNIYISGYEKYVIEGQAYYNDINKL